MEEITFTETQRQRGRACLRRGEIVSIVFSEGTYQLTLLDEEHTYWPFIQITDTGKVLDSFCSCKEEMFCPHVVASYYYIFSKGKPLHQRFRESFWRKICFIASKLHGFRADTLLEGNGWEALSLTGEKLFSIVPLDAKGEEKLQGLFTNRPVETEETSLKFSNLSDEELQMYRKGRPSPELQFALSFWYDLSHLLFGMEEEGEKYNIFSFPKEEIPQWIEVVTSCFKAKFYIPRKELAELIPSFEAVAFPLKVFNGEEIVTKSISYNAKKEEFHLEVDKEKVQKIKGEQIGPYLFVKGQGFFYVAIDPILLQKKIGKDQIDDFFAKKKNLIQKFVKEEIHIEAISPEVFLEVTKRKELIIRQYLFEIGDLEREGAALFRDWIYLPEGGFYRIQKPKFASAITRVLEKDLLSFLKSHRDWLQNIEGFALHSVCIESDLLFAVDKKNNLAFFLPEEGEEVISFEEFVFVPGRGFFPKKEKGALLESFAGKVIPKEEVSSFIRRHSTQLAELPHFFASEALIEKGGISVTVRAGKIFVEPAYVLSPSCVDKRTCFFGEYLYVEGKGFALPPFLPKEYGKYIQEEGLSPKQEKHFLAHYQEIAPWIIQLDPQLKAPQELVLKVISMEESEGKKEGHWVAELVYQSLAGEVSIFSIWEAMGREEKYLISPAGLLDLSKGRYDWIRSLGARRFAEKGKKIHFNALEWIRLQASELIEIPQGGGGKEQKTREICSTFASGEGIFPLETSTLKSNLRSYQKMGLKWLWFLYGYGLSGLLCDEMGLGKTHQAMALLSAVAARKKGEARFLVICPTSVLYHWEELLRVFLPDLKVLLYYGQGRKKESLLTEYDILISSYGIVRSDKKELSAISFDVAIYDEIQHVKNHLSKTHKALKGLQTGIRIGLTGTPIENRLAELKALFDLVLPRYLPSDAFFKEHFILPIEKERNPERKEALSRMVKPFILRRKKSEVLAELPAKVEEIAYCDLSQEQKELYQQLVYTYKREIINQWRDDNYKGMHIFALFSKLKQVCDHPALITGEAHLYNEYTSGKWDLFVELLEEARGSNQKIVVFTQYLQMMDIIKKYLREQKIGFAEIRGSTRDRRGEVVRFQTDPSCEVFIGSLQAAGVGIDLTAASVVIHYDRWWNPAKENQATDRVHRIGQSKGVQVFKLVVKKTIEERIHELIEKKKGLLDEVVGFDEQDVIKSFTKEELFALFSSLEEDMK